MSRKYIQYFITIKYFEKKLYIYSLYLEPRLINYQKYIYFFFYNNTTYFYNRIVSLKSKKVINSLYIRKNSERIVKVKGLLFHFSFCNSLLKVALQKIKKIWFRITAS